MCDFKPGDEVVCVDAGPVDWPWTGDAPIEGSVYNVIAVGPSRLRPGQPVVFLAEIRNDGDGINDGYLASRFRKVQKSNDGLSIEAFLTIKPGQFEEPRRTVEPAKKRERAS